MTRPTTLKKTRLPFLLGSPTHSLLNYSKMRRDTPFSVDNVIYVLSGRYTRPSSVVRSINTLVGAGLLKPVDGRWVITERGVAAVYEVAGRAKTNSQTHPDHFN